VREIVLGVTPDGDNYYPPFFSVGTETPEFGKYPSPWRYEGQFNAENRKPSKKYLCLLLRSTALEVGKGLREVFLILEPSLAHTSNNTYRRI
jgi:hypothetical protein